MPGAPGSLLHGAGWTCGPTAPRPDRRTMFHPKTTDWDNRMKEMFDRIDTILENRYHGSWKPRRNRPDRGQTANPEADGLFNVGVFFTPGFGSRPWPGLPGGDRPGHRRGRAPEPRGTRSSCSSGTSSWNSFPSTSRPQADGGAGRLDVQDPGGPGPGSSLGPKPAPRHLPPPPGTRTSA
ncbi:MAG: hypothetical protein MZV70_69415 [Desulfobacterales bacterium]|nr:hypothetical protein [Desulfobacterales bacterium]